MSMRQWKRWDGISRLEGGKLSTSEAAAILGLSVRQVRRLRRKVESLGTEALRHGNAGRTPVNRVDPDLRRRVLELRRDKYSDFNDQHFAEKLLGERPPLPLSRSTIRRILREGGIAAVRRRRARRHRRRRDRKPQAGLMLLWDGSRHAWLEDRGPMLCLVGAVDDATSELIAGAHFVEQECSAAYLRLLLTMGKTRGLPWAIYMDQHSALKRSDQCWTLAEEYRGTQDPTQVGTALAALEIEPIYALSPQAKGRVERAWGTLQDRLVSELRLGGARTAAEANAVLDRYLPQHNARFAVAPRDSASAWRPVRPGIDLERVCSFRYEATVQKDNTVRLGSVLIDLPPGPRRRSWADLRVEVRQLLDGSWRVYSADRVIGMAEATEQRELRARKRNRRRGERRGAPNSGPRHAVFDYIDDENRASPL